MKVKAFYNGEILGFRNRVRRFNEKRSKENVHSGIECKNVNVNGKKSKEDVSSRKFVSEDFKAIQNPIVFYLLPWVSLLSLSIMVLLLILKQSNFFDDKVIIAWLPIIISGYFVAGMCLFAQRLFMKKIPEIFIKLWCRKIIVGAHQSGKAPSNIDSKDSKVITPMNVPLEERYLQFIYGIQKRLNSPLQWIFSIFFFLLTLLWNPLKTLNFPLLWSGFLALLNHWNNISDWQKFIENNWHLLNELPVTLIAIMLGLMVWRMYVASTSIGKLVNEFQIEPKLGHQDMAGGLSPLGSLCLWNCTIASLPSIYLSVWLLMGNLDNFSSPYPDIPNYYTYEFLILLFSLSFLPIAFCFIRPLKKVHREMNYWRNSKQERLHYLGSLIHEKESKLLHETEDLLDKTEKQLDKTEKKLMEDFESIHKELEMMKQLYKRNEKLPIWPFNMEILGKLLITYLIPILSIISQFMSLIPSLHQ